MEQSLIAVVLGIVGLLATMLNLFIGFVLYNVSSRQTRHESQTREDINDIHNRISDNERIMNAEIKDINTNIHSIKSELVKLGARLDIEGQDSKES